METGRSQVQQSRGEQPTDGRVVTAAEVLPEECRSESYPGPPARGASAGKGGRQCLALRASRASFQESRGLGQIEAPLLKG